MKPFTKHHKKYFREAVKLIESAESSYYAKIKKIENRLKKQTGIDIEVFHVDSSAVGFGDYDKTYKLIHFEEL